MNFLRIGLTGGPGCGKSEAGRIFSTFPGWHCLDADKVCHEIYSEPDSPFAGMLEARWGATVRGADGLPDRKVIAEKIFNDENERGWLNSVLHPEIFARLERQAEQAGKPYLVIEADGAALGYAYAGPFKGRAAYDWSCEISIYLDAAARGRGLGRALYEALESALRAMGVLNAYACIAWPEPEDEYLTRASAGFHAWMGFALAGRYHRCGRKFGRWYDMIWMEKLIGGHGPDQPPVTPWPQVARRWLKEASL